MDNAEIRQRLIRWWNFAREYVRSGGSFESAVAQCGPDSEFGLATISGVLLEVQRQGGDVRDFCRFAALLDEHIGYPDSSTTMTDLRVAMKLAYLMLVSLDIDPDVEWSRWMSMTQAAKALGCTVAKKSQWLQKHIKTGKYRAEFENRQTVRLDLATVPEHLRDKFR